MDFFRFRLFLNSSATDIVLVTLPSTAVETAVPQCTSRCAMASGHRFNTSIVLAAVHGLSGLFRAVSAVEPSLSLAPPPPPLSPSLISNLASVDVKQHGQGHAGVKGNDRAVRLAGKATLTSGLLLGRSEVLRSLRHYMRAQSQGHHTGKRCSECGIPLQ